MIAILVEQTTSESQQRYEHNFLTQWSERVRNEVNTFLAAGRADLCILDN